MVTPKKMVARQAADCGLYADYLTSVESSGDYYVNADGDPWASPGEWGGRGAVALGLLGMVTAEDLRMIFEGRDPRTGEQIIRRGANGEHVMAHDLTFSAPSSVTALWAAGSAEARAAIQDAHDQAVRDAMRYVEDELPLVRRRDPSQRAAAFERKHGRPPTADELRETPAPIIKERQAGLVYSTYAHHTSRQTEAQERVALPPDPQLHTHVPVAMALRRDGKFAAIDSYTLTTAAPEIGAMYRASLAGRLAQLGAEIERRTGTGGYFFEVQGVPVGLREEWSSRRDEATSRLAEWRVEFRHSTGRDPSIREERSWVAKTRAGKQRWHRGRLSDQWGGMAAAHGLTRERVDGLLRRRVGGSLPGRADGRRRLVAELLGAEGLTATDATFDAGRARRLAWERAPGLVTAEDVELAVRELVEREEVVAVAPGVWTTKEMQELEEQVLAWRRRRAERRDDSDADELDPTAWLEALARCPLTLTEEQQAALEAVVSEETWVALTGEAGVGKGVVLRVASDTWDGEGRRVFALAVAGKRAQALATDLGEHAEAMTLDAFTRRVRDRKITVGPNDVVALDEASLVDTRRWAGLADVLGDRGLVRAIGDDAQLSSIAPGGLWRHLSDQGPRLSEVRRTRHAWERQAWTHLRAGEARDALELYARRGRVHISDTRAAALEQAVAAWDRDGRSGLIITDASNAERHKLNALAQGLRQAAGELGTSTVRFRGVAGEVNLHEGDRVSFRAQYRPETGRRVENGVGAEVIGVDALRGLVGVRTHEERPRLLQVSVEDFRDLDLAYAAHVHKAQGDTVERGYIVSGGWQTNRESLYVAASRSRDGAEIFLDRQTLGRDADPDVLVAMAARADRSGRKVASVEGELPTARQERGYEGRSLRDAATEAPRSEWAPNVGDGLAAAVRAAERADALDALGSARPAFDAGLGWRDLSAREAVRMVQSRDLRPVENGGGTGPYNGARSGVSRQEHQRQAARPPQPTRTPPQPTPSLPGDR